MEDSRAPGINVGVKDGWHPEETGWRTNSAGFYEQNSRCAGFTIAILTQGESTLSDGIQAIEELAAPIENKMMNRWVCRTKKSKPIVEFESVDYTHRSRHQLARHPYSRKVKVR